METHQSFQSCSVNMIKSIFKAVWKKIGKRADKNHSERHQPEKIKKYQLEDKKRGNVMKV